MTVIYISRKKGSHAEVGRDARDFVQGRDSVILGRLTRSEYKALDGLRYSGSTGVERDQECIDPYIATFGSELAEGIERLKWNRIRMVKIGYHQVQWKVTRIR